MSDFITGIIGTMLCITTAQVTEWVGLICTAIITLVTCGIQAYRLIRDRNKDKETKQKEQENNEEKN
jgi:phosphotransferase system  glucose/maltose/N-acetylglucosamine-specific IIC component